MYFGNSKPSQLDVCSIVAVLAFWTGLMSDPHWPKWLVATILDGSGLQDLSS